MELTHEDIVREARQEFSPGETRWIIMNILNMMESHGSFYRQMIEDSVFDYSNLSWQEKFRIHEDALAYYRNQVEFWSDRCEDILDATKELPISEGSFMEEAELNLYKFSDLLRQEEDWRGGWEDGQSQTDGPHYDDLDEL